jgi:hypothetical protein
VSDSWQKLAELVVLAEASATHKRLQGQLREWARSRSFTIDYDNLDGLQPDVLCGDEAKRWAFIGDAKVSSHEGPNTAATCARLFRYFVAFAELLRNKERGGGILAVATDASDVAGAWIPQLELLASIAGLSGPGNSRPSFRVDDIGGGCWVTWW